MMNLAKQTIVAAVLGLSLQAGANLKAIRAEMDAFQKPQVDAFRQVLETDRELSPEYKIFLAEGKELQNIKDPEVRVKKSIQINEKHKSLFEKAMKKSKADPESTRRYAKKLEKKYSGKSYRYRIETGLFMTYIAWLEQQQQQQQPPAETEITFSAPFSFEHNSKAGGGTVQSDLETGEFYVSNSNLFIGAFTNKAGLGDFVRVPWATRTVRVSARLPESRVHLIATSIGGGSGLSASSIIDVQTEDQERCEEVQEHGTVVAPVAWHAELELDATTVMACEMAAPPANQDIAVRFQGAVESTVGGMATAYGNITSKPEPIRVRLIE